MRSAQPPKGNDIKDKNVIEIKVPVFPESVSDGTLSTWHKRPGEAVNNGDII